MNKRIRKKHERRRLLERALRYRFPRKVTRLLTFAQLKILFGWRHFVGSENLYYVLDKRGNPRPARSMAEYMEFKGDHSRSVIALDVFEDFARVSTVFTGINYNFMEGPPLVFETMIFGGKYNLSDWRASTRRGALANHQRAVALVRAALAKEGGHHVDPR